MPANDGVPMPKASPLPAPWLSERTGYWQRSLSTEDREPTRKPYQILLMSNKLSRFPPAPSGAHSTINHVHEFASTLRAFIEQAGRREIKILHKPYNPATKHLLRETFRPYAVPDHPLHRFASELEKGLTPSLVKSCGVVVWDQPGTGFLECLAAGIPNLVLWTRLFSSESPFAIDAFRNLEQAGLVHRNADSLLDEVQAFHADPLSWMNNSGRRAAAREFCRRFGWVEADWPGYWRRFLRELRS